ncbi:MAG: DinB family protein, partial [Anaerolineae bacterium]|nr:DinB family protein [Anaerolineae bacterium]
MNPSERKTLIAQYGRGFKDLLAALDDFPKEMWQFRPAPGEWSIHEIIIHLADSETNSYLRARRLVSDPGEAIMGYDQDKWATTLDYHSQDAQSAL